jgi:GNAT superfamily N-acetyltransferase
MEKEVYPIELNKPWYHGSPEIIDTLREGSTITQWKELAIAFSHKPTELSYDKIDGEITHNGTEQGYLYVIDEPVVMDTDIYPHPKSSMDKNVEYLTKRLIKLRMVGMKYNLIDKNDVKQLQTFYGLWTLFCEESYNGSFEDMMLSANRNIGAQDINKRPDFRYELCYDDNKIIGFCGYAINGIQKAAEYNRIPHTGYGHIMDMYVTRECRRKGYGRKMIEHIGDILKKYGCNHLWLTPNDKAETFYEHCGFTWSGKLDNDAHTEIMWKEI